MQLRRHIPNLLTLLRAGLCPVIAFAVFRNRLDWAAVLFVLAAVSDFLDGYLARRWRAETRLGTVLDPLCDKITVLTLFALLLWLGSCPRWFFAFALSAFLAQASGWLLLVFSSAPGTLPRPTRAGKWNLALQLFWIGIALSDLWLQRSLPRNFRHSAVFHETGYFILAALQVGVLVRYFERFRTRLLTELRAFPPIEAP